MASFLMALLAAVRSSGVVSLVPSKTVRTSEIIAWDQTDIVLLRPNFNVRRINSLWPGVKHFWLRIYAGTGGEQNTCVGDMMTRDHRI